MNRVTGSACPKGFPADEWLRLAVALCPEAAQISSPGQFANPVKHRLSALAASLETFLCTEHPGQAGLDEFTDCLEDFIRVLAARAAAPDELMGLFFSLKNFEDWPLGLESCKRVDAAATLAMCLYCRFREQLTMLKLDEERRKYGRVLRYLEDGLKEAR